MNSDERNDHPLLHVLRSRNPVLADEAARVIHESPRLLEYTLSTFPGGTDHTERHTKTVEKIGRMLLSDSFLSAMSDEEIYFLAVSCHFHDLAMAGTEADDKTPETRDQVRRDHAVRIGGIVSEKWAELGFASPRKAQILGEICRGHRPKKNAEGAANWDDLNQTEVLGPGVAVRVRLLAALIYAIDELHLGADRAPERVQNWRNIQDEESRKHWRRHQAVSGPVLHSPTMLLFQVNADTPEFEENLRSQVFRKAFSAISDLKKQAISEGMTETLPLIAVQWQRQPSWELLLSVTCADMTPRSVEEVVETILVRFRKDTAGRIGLEGVCTEIGNTEPELVASVRRIVEDAITKGHLTAVPLPARGLVLSTAGAHADVFFKQTLRADDLDLLFVGRFRSSWEQELFASEFGRRYIRGTVFPVVERTYSVQLTQLPAINPNRVLLESCPTAARLVRDFAPPPSNLVKEALLAQATVTGALIDLYADPERLLDESLRTAIRFLTAENAGAVPVVRLLEELALVGGFTWEQVSAATIPSDAEQEAIEEQHPKSDSQLSIHLTQSLSQKAPGTSQLHRLLLASKRAGTPILLTAATECDLQLRIEGNDELANKESAGFVLGVNPAVKNRPASFKLPARIEVSRPTRTVRFYLGQFSDNVPTPYPVGVTLPPLSKVGMRQTATFETGVNWPELTVRDMRTLELANQVVRDSRARIELIIEADDRVLGTLENPQSPGLFRLGKYEGNIQRALRGLDSTLPGPVRVSSSAYADIANLDAGNRTLRWQKERDKDGTQKQRVSSVFLRLTTSNGRPFEERFLRFLPFQFFPAPKFESNEAMNGEELSRQWNEAENDFLISAYYSPDIHELARDLCNWCENPKEDFPFQFSPKGKSDPITRSMMTIRLLRCRDRVWHSDRAIIFEFRPVNRREAYQMEATYWREYGDEPRAKLAQEICERESSST